MKKAVQSLLAVLSISVQALFAQDTFSIIAVDTLTGEVGSAGASCVDASAFGGVKLLSGLVPGKGGINAQATVCLPIHFNLVNGLEQMELGLSPEEIIEYLVDNDACNSGNFTNRQYGIVDFGPNGFPRSTAYTGSNTIPFAGHIIGPNYAIQGNILLGQELLDSMEARFLAEEGPLAKKLMAALQGANVPGADTRCLDEGTSSLSAFLRVAGPNDSPDSLFLELNVPIAPIGIEPIDSLQKLFDEWYGTVSFDPSGKRPSLAKVYPNPTSATFTLDWPYVEPSIAILSDITGKELHRQSLANGKNRLVMPCTVNPRLFLLRVQNETGRILFSEKLVFQKE